MILVIDGLGWIVTPLQPYLWPHANLDWVLVTALGEVIFMVWLLIWGFTRAASRQGQPNT